MDPQTVLQKTEKGVQEIQTRSFRLEQRLRNLLIVINGKSTVADLASQFARLGDIGPLLEHLVAEGFVKSSATPDFKDVRLKLSQLLSDALGPDGDGIVMQLELCRSLEEIRTFITKERGFLQRVQGPRIIKFFDHAKELLR